MKKLSAILIISFIFCSHTFADQSDIDTHTDTTLTTTRYTFSDFFDALDLPTVLGVGINPTGIESASFNSAMRLGWRHHKNYGTFVYLTYDAHSSTYDSLMIDGTNVSCGEVWYHEVGVSVGYRIPLVKDIKAFYTNPCFHSWDFYAAIQPTMVIDIVKNAVAINPSTSSNNLSEETSYRLEDIQSITPALRLSAGVEWFIFSNFGVFAECAYTQHLMPTMVEKAAIGQRIINHPAGNLNISIGLSLFFN